MMQYPKTLRTKPEIPIRILRIIARLNVGGPSIQAITLAKDLSSDGYKSLLVTGKVGTNEEDMGYLAREKDVKPITIVELGREISLLNDIRAFLVLRRIVRKFKPHIVHTHTAKAGTVGRLAAVSVNLTSFRSRRIKIVHTFHGHVFHSYFKSYKTFIFVLIERVLAKFTSRIIVISNLQKIDICSRFKIAADKKVNIIPLGFDLSKFGKDKKTRKIVRAKYLNSNSKNKFLVGIVGRLTDVKNHSLLIRAFKVLKDRKVDYFKCILVGDGELKESLMSEVLKLGLKDSFIFVGWQKDMPSLYQAFDVVVTTSRNEGTPVTLIEAMASGIPVAATDVGGVRDLFGSLEGESDQGFSLAQNGILIRPGDAEAVANALMFLFNEKERAERMAERARDFIQKNYSFDRLSYDIRSLYRELVPDNH
ncbi:glycosyltransferase family 4 protein [Thermodesulfobacteriota bacterium]